MDNYNPADGDITSALATSNVNKYGVPSCSTLTSATDTYSSSTNTYSSSTWYPYDTGNNYIWTSIANNVGKIQNSTNVDNKLHINVKSRKLFLNFML